MSTLCHSMCLTITLSSTIDTNRSFSVLIYSSPILISIYDYSGYGASTDMTILTVYFPENHPCFLKLIYVELNLLMGLFNYLLLVGLSDYYLPISINFFLYFAQLLVQMVKGFCHLVFYIFSSYISCYLTSVSPWNSGV